MMLKPQDLRQKIHYDPATGNFTRCGAIAGFQRPDGYRLIKIDGRRYYAHRLAWLYMTGEWPTGHVDHADADTSNNKWANLRQTDRSKNIANSKRRSDNASGFKGVRWHKKSRKWLAQITVQNRHIHLGCFNSPELAHAAYVSAAKRSFGEFARAA